MKSLYFVRFHLAKYDEKKWNLRIFYSGRVHLSPLLCDIFFNRYFLTYCTRNGNNAPLSSRWEQNGRILNDTFDRSSREETIIYSSKRDPTDSIRFSSRNKRVYTFIAEMCILSIYPPAATLNANFTIWKNIETTVAKRQNCLDFLVISMDRLHGSFRAKTLSTRRTDFGPLESVEPRSASTLSE